MSSLEWTKIHPDALGSRTKCQRYSTCVDPAGSWEVWKLAPGGPWFAQLGGKLPSEEAAKERAEQDAAQ